MILHSELYLAIVLGMVLSLIFAERFGIVPAGLVVAGYLALVLDQPILVLLIFSIAFVTFFIVTKGIGRFTILYGRRKFAAMLLVAVLLKLGIDYAYPLLPFEIYELRGIGVIVPGLIANGIQKQGALLTVGSSLLLAALTYGGLFLVSLF